MRSLKFRLYFDLSCNIILITAVIFLMTVIKALNDRIEKDEQVIKNNSEYVVNHEVCYSNHCHHSSEMNKRIDRLYDMMFNTNSMPFEIRSNDSILVMPCSNKENK